jgi:glycosyltransferase involved in cell wall biosynthesis
MLVSYVIPALNEGSRLPGFLEDLGRHLRSSAPDDPAVEVIVVDDGSRPDELRVHRVAVNRLAEMLAGSPHRALLCEMQTNRGKGEAIRRGWANSAADAEWVGFVDADGAVPAKELMRLTGMLSRCEHDVLAGARIRMAGRTIRRTGFRHIQGRVFATAVEWMLSLGFYDPQCGVKVFRAARLRPHLHEMRERSWLLDVEVLALIQRRGGRAREEPIDWSDPGGSKVSFALDPFKMFVGLWNLRRRLDRGAAG